ncbi:MAG: ABC transporter substrate-binding protein [Paludibacter sp.]|nr:ABC transporter substrate-binding protein [Paludibacter sp.]
MKKVNQKLQLLLFLLTMIFSFFSCTKKSQDTIRIGILEGPSVISFIKMIEKPMKISGKKVEIIIKSEPQQIQALMIQKELDFAVLPTVMAANLYNKGVNFRMLACPIWGTMYILSNDPAIKSIQDLENKNIGIFGQGITPDILLQNLLKINNVKNLRIDYTFTTNSDLANALLQKKIRCAVISEPLVSVLLTKDTTIKNITKLNCEDYINNLDTDIFVQTAFTVNNTFSEKYPEMVKYICDEYSKSCNFVNSQPLEAANLAVKLKILPDLNTAMLSLPLCNIHYVSAFAIEQELKHYLHLFLNYDPKSIGGKIPAKDFIYQTY